MKNIIFDVGRVLIQWDVNPLFQELFGSQETADQFINEVNFFNWNLELDRGKLFADGVAEMSAKYPHHQQVFEQFHKRWTDTVPGPITETFNILKRLQENNVPTYAITNFSNETWPIACKMFPELGTSFIDTIVSGDVKMTKPDAAIFELLLERNNLIASDCIFIDDSPANIVGAKSVGIDALLFTTPRKFEQDLKDRGVL